MNRTFTYILVGGASALIGGLAGYFFCKKQFQDKFDDALSDAINEELGKIRRNKTREKTVDFDIHKNEFRKEAKELFQITFPDRELNPYQEVLISTCLEECYANSLDSLETEEKLNELFASFESPPEDIPEEDLGESYEDDAQAVMDDYASQPPQVISQEEYAALPPYFEFLTYKYFEDDVLVDDGEEIITDIEGIVGDALEYFNSDDSIYVINGQHGTAIEIIRMNSTYAAWIGFGG